MLVEFFRNYFKHTIHILPTLSSKEIQVLILLRANRYLKLRFQFRHLLLLFPHMKDESGA